MKGYNVPFGYMGYVPYLRKWILFSTESEYKEYIA